MSKEIESTGNIRCRSFAVALPRSIAMDDTHHLDDHHHRRPPPPPPMNTFMDDNAAVVGSILFLKSSTMIWLGWGHTTTTSPTAESAMTRVEGAVDASAAGSPSTTAGTGVPSHMGPMVIAFPRTTYQGSMSSSSLSSNNNGTNNACSQLVGGDSNDDQVMATQMALRLSQTTKTPILCSCALSTTAPSQDWMAGMDMTIVTQRAAALAERHVRKILNQELHGQS